MNIIWIGAHTNNYGKGREGKRVNKIVLHWIVGNLTAADTTFNDGRRQASATYGVGNGQIHQYVKEEDTAYHAGNYDVNLQSIGIEHEGGPNLPITDGVYKTSSELVADICRRYQIPLDRQHIHGHSEFKATQCPGTLDIDRVIREAKSLSTIDQQSLIDQLRADRDKNWNLYQQEQQAKIQLEDAVSAKQKTIDVLTKENLTIKEMVVSKDEETKRLSTSLRGLTRSLDDTKVALSVCEGRLSNLKDLAKYSDGEIFGETWKRITSKFKRR